MLDKLFAFGFADLKVFIQNKSTYTLYNVLISGRVCVGRKSNEDEFSCGTRK
jgi:hypothetical protein